MKASCSRVARRAALAGFTLIEVLVVVAIIALLISILLPSLSRARDQARLSVCLTNARTLGMACATYAAEWKGRFPGAGRHTDWLGKNNVDNSKHFGRTPIDGTIYRYVGKQSQAYLCPSDPLRGEKVYYEGANGYASTFHSYQLAGPMGGARAEAVAGAHVPGDGNFVRTDHRLKMMPLDGVPLIVEGLYKGYSYAKDTPSGYFETRFNSSWWVEDASVANRHLRRGTDTGASSIAWHDGSAKAVYMPGVPEELVDPNRASERSGQMYRWFHAKSVCVRTTGRKWVSWRDFNTNQESYGWLDRARSASEAGVQHP
jgi:prepilin-type N-terminal cleavage/methylation domain-containing protein